MRYLWVRSLWKTGRRGQMRYMWVRSLWKTGQRRRGPRRSASATPGRRRLPEKRPTPLRAAVLGPLPSNRPTLFSAAAQNLQSCRPQGRSPAVLHRLARMPLSCRLQCTSRLPLQWLCPSRLQARAGKGGKERGSSIGQGRLQRAVCTQLRQCRLPPLVCMGVRAQQLCQALRPP